MRLDSPIRSLVEFVGNGNIVGTRFGEQKLLPSTHQGEMKSKSFCK